MKPQRYRVIKEYKSPYPVSLPFRKGEEVEVGSEFKEDLDWKDWIWCEANSNRKAWVPKQFVEINGKKGTFNRDYNALELSVHAGEKLSVYEIVNGFGMSEKTNGMRGWVPMRNLQIDEE
jgi:hypothetical protein